MGKLTESVTEKAALKEADAALWREYEESPTPLCRERIVRRYLPLVKYVVARMSVVPPQGLDLEDLWSFGVFGLLEALERYDRTTGYSFQTFAVPRIRGAVLDELRRCDWLTRTGREKVQRLHRATEKVLRDKGRIQDDWVMHEMGVDVQAYNEALELSSRSYISSLDEVLILEEGEVSLSERLMDDRGSALDALEKKDDVAQVVHAMRHLPERELQVLSLYYYEGMSLKEIGKILGVSESRVSQIHGKAIAELRAYLTECGM